MSYQIYQNSLSKPVRNAAVAEWIESHSDKLDLFALTAVFKSSSELANPTSWEPELDKVFNKINKKLSRHSCPHKTDFTPNQLARGVHRLPLGYSPKPIVRDLMREYEFGDTGKIVAGVKKRVPHHFHCAIGIPKGLSPRVWDATLNQPVERLIKDFNSMKKVSSVLIVPLGDALQWVNYATKTQSYF